MPAMTIQEITKCQKNKTPLISHSECVRPQIGFCLGYKEAYGITYVLFREKQYPQEARWIPSCNVRIASEEEIAAWKEERIYELESKLARAVDELVALRDRVKRRERQESKHWWNRIWNDDDD